jgi:hypothetical protein
MVIAGIEADPRKAGELTRWTRAYSEPVQPHSTDGGYINFMMEEGDGRIRAAYGDNYDRLVALKGKYDPHNFFSANQNVKPGDRPQSGQ